MNTFPCARCSSSIQCWPYRAGKAVCEQCLAEIRRENGRRVGSGQTPEAGATRIRTFRGRRYEQTYVPTHPNAPKSGWVMSHRLAWEEANGRLLTRAEVVHHVDHDSINNDPANLRLYPSKGAHLAAEHSADGVVARMAGYPLCGCGKRTAYGSDECWACWKRSQTCPACGRDGRKMATRAMCHGCYKRHRRPVSTASEPNSPC